MDIFGKISSGKLLTVCVIFVSLLLNGCDKKRATEDQRTPQTAEADGFKAEIIGIHLKQGKNYVEPENYPLTEHQLHWWEETELRWALRWPAGKKPLFYAEPILEEVIDGTGKALEIDDPRPYLIEIDDHEDIASDEVRLRDAPELEAKTLKSVKGYLPVVVAIERQTAAIAKPLEKIGEGALAGEDNEELRKAGVFLKGIDANSVHIRSQGNRVLNASLLKAEGTRQPGEGGYAGFTGSEYRYSFSFDSDIAADDILEVELRVKDTRVNVPLEGSDLSLP